MPARRLFLWRRRPRGALAGETGFGKLLAHLDEFAGQSAQTLAFLDLGARHGGAFGGDGAGRAIAVRIEDELQVGAVAGVVFAHAMASGPAALGAEFAHEAGAQGAHCGNAGEDAGALLFEGANGVAECQGLLSLRNSV